MSGSPAATAVEGAILAAPLRGRSQRESAQGSSALWAARPKERGAKTWRSRGHGLRDHRADSAAYGRTGSGSGLTDGE